MDSHGRYKTRSGRHGIGRESEYPVNWQRLSIVMVLAPAMWEEIENYGGEQGLSRSQVCRKIIREWAEARMKEAKHG